MNIQWFPGHMTKALRMMEENSKLVDAFLYLLDARAAASCFNPEYVKLIGNKTTVYIMNKSDLASERGNAAWMKHFTESNQCCVLSDASKPAAAKSVAARLVGLFAEKTARLAQKGMTKSIRAMVIGVPNSGKSTLINALCGEKRALTGDKPGVTRGKQWVKVGSSLELLDTPGTLYPAFSDQVSARHLAYIGSINDDILDVQELCLELLGELGVICPGTIANRYGVAEVAESPLAVYESICRARGFLIRGGECDYERCARAVLDDFRKGRLGRISLELPAVSHAGV